MTTKNNNLSQFITRLTYVETIKREVLTRVHKYQRAHPEKEIYMMGYGDTSQPIPKSAVVALSSAVTKLGDSETYTGYEDVIGNLDFRKIVSQNYYQEKLGVSVDPSEVFVSDGGQSVSVSIQELFGLDNLVAIQNPAYPSFVEGTLLAGRQIIDLPCREQNSFVPQLPQRPVDIIYLCFPNNPTGAVASKKHLRAFVKYAMSHDAVIIFDAVYSLFITSPNIPRSIYEIEGAKECAIEINSFSKMANCTGLRIGWCIIPHTLQANNYNVGELNHMWAIRHSIKFWGACNLAQQAGIAILSKQGQKECHDIVKYYLYNAKLLRHGLEAAHIKCFGGINNPFIWCKNPIGMSSWQFFDYLLQKTGIVGIPGNIFGSEGESYLRLSALLNKKDIENAVSKLSTLI